MALSAFLAGLSEQERESFKRGIIDVFPGCKMGLSLNDVRAMLAKYKDINRSQLQGGLYARACASYI